MYTSPKSERVALLWGDRWWVEGLAGPVVFGELTRAAETLLAALAGDRPARLRLIHQPACLSAESVACPKGDRATLQVVLGEQFPALFSEDRAWAFEPVVGGMDQYATVLYHESQSVLYPLVRQLQDAGIVVAGAWPLAHLLNLVPEDWPETGALTVVAAAEGQTLIYRHAPDGRREVLSAVGEDARRLALATVQATLTRMDSALVLVALDAAGEQVAGELPPLDAARLRLVGWSRLVAAAETLSRRQPAQLLPLSALFNPGRALIAASVTLALTALGLAGHHSWADFRGRQEAAANTRAITAARTEIVARRQAQEELASLRATVESGAAALPVFAPLLRSLGAAIPGEVVLTSLRADRERLTVAGGVTRTLSKENWSGWLRSWEGSWVLSDPAEVPAADFQITALRRS